MDLGVVYGRGLSFPPRLGADGRMAWSAGPDNIRESIRMVLATSPQERSLDGLGSQLKALLEAPNTVATHSLIQSTIEQSLERWEPRIRLQEVAVKTDPEEPSRAIATISYRLVADNSGDSISLGINLSGVA